VFWLGNRTTGGLGTAASWMPVMVNRLVVVVLGTTAPDCEAAVGVGDVVRVGVCPLAMPVMVSRLVVAALGLFAPDGEDAVGVGVVDRVGVCPSAMPVMVSSEVVVVRSACAWAMPFIARTAMAVQSIDPTACRATVLRAIGPFPARLRR
jgi:hypothetical protein